MGFVIGASGLKVHWAWERRRHGAGRRLDLLLFPAYEYRRNASGVQLPGQRRLRTRDRVLHHEGLQAAVAGACSG